MSIGDHGYGDYEPTQKRTSGLAADSIVPEGQRRDFTTELPPRTLSVKLTEEDADKLKELDRLSLSVDAHQLRTQLEDALTVRDGERPSFPTPELPEPRENSSVSPKHYASFPDMQALDVMRNTLTATEYIGYLKGNALKYRLRLGKKENVQIEDDLQKACQYEGILAMYWDASQKRYIVQKD